MGARVPCERSAADRSCLASPDQTWPAAQALFICPILRPLTGCGCLRRRSLFASPRTACCGRMSCDGRSSCFPAPRTRIGHTVSGGPRPSRGCCRRRAC
eukprot:scaffold4665_cov101-Isochrysis_galbana.AAC.1